jgi:hypothetical protein
VVTLFFFYSLTWTYRHPANEQPAVAGAPADVLDYEASHPAAAGTTYQNEFLPRGAEQVPAADTLRARYAADSTPSRLADVPAGVAVLAEESGLLASRLTLAADAPWQAAFHLFYFPGWAARLDGRPWPLSAQPGTGRIVIDVPAGRHTLDLRRTLTWPQGLGLGASAVALLWLALSLRRAPQASPLEPPAAFAARPSAALALACLGLLGLRVLALDRAATPFQRSRLGRLPDPQRVDFGGQLALIGSELPDGAVDSGQPFEAAIYWQALADLERDYHASLQIADEHGNRWGQSDQFPGLIPTSLWRPGQYARDMHTLASLAGTPPGGYRLVVRVYALDAGGPAALSILENGQPAALEHDVGAVTIVRGPPQAPGPTRLLEASLGLGEAGSVGAGDFLPLTLVWSSGNAPAPGLAARVELSNRAAVHRVEFPPAGPGYPSGDWTPNELIRHPHSLLVPADFPAGPATVTVAFVSPGGEVLAGPFDAGRVEVTVPERSFDIPPISRRVDHDFNGAIRLLGYDMTADGLTLYWQALRLVPARLTVFVHQLDEAGARISGQDAPPARPSTSWLPGEVIVDRRPLTPGQRFAIGLYDPATGERFGEPLIVMPSP